MSVTIGDKLPRRGNPISRWIGRSFLWLIGWRIEGSLPNLPKMVMIGAPHTSNMDGVVSIATLVALGIRASTMIKDSAFKGVMGPILRGFGAIPINRKSPKGVVEQTVDAFANNAQMVMLIAPEGTRHSAQEWKRGYWHIALGAGVPVLPACVHYGKKIVTFGPPLMPSGNYAADLAQLLEFYVEHAGPRHPDRLSLPLKNALQQPRDGL